MKIVLFSSCSFLIAINLKKENPDFSYLDKYDNKIVIENYATLPKIIDTTFFKNNVSSFLIDEELTEKDFNFDLRIIEIKKMSRKKFDLLIYIQPQKRTTKDINDILKFSGVTHYEMIIAKTGNVVKLIKIKRLFGEI